MPPENVGPEEYGCPWQTISRLYELLAQVCAALGLNSVSALFYSLSVQSVMHLPPGALVATLAPLLALRTTLTVPTRARRLSRSAAAPRCCQHASHTACMQRMYWRTSWIRCSQAPRR
jgi:hypothetical protein